MDYSVGSVGRAVVLRLRDGEAIYPAIEMVAQKEIIKSGMVGEITSVAPQKPYEKNNVRVEFEIVEPYFRYLWTGGSYVKVNAAGFLNQRQLEVTRATNGYALVVTQPRLSCVVGRCERPRRCGT